MYFLGACSTHGYTKVPKHLNPTYRMPGTVKFDPEA